MLYCIVSVVSKYCKRKSFSLVIISSRSQARRPACTHGSNAGTYWTLSLSDRRMSV